MKSSDWTKRPHVDVMSDKEARDQAKASKKKKHSKNPKPITQQKSDAQLAQKVINSPVAGNNKIPNSLGKTNHTKVTPNVSSPLAKGKITNSPSKNKTANKSKDSSKFNNLAHKHSTGATNWQKFLAEGAEGVKKKVPTIKNTSVENR